MQSKLLMDIILGVRDVLHVSGRLSQEHFLYFQCYTDISELNEGINPNPFPNKKYGQGHHIGTYWGSWSPSKESGTSSKSSWWMPNQLFSIVKLERSVIHQIISILQDFSIGALKINFGHHNWSQECPPCIRKASSGTIFFFLKNSIQKILKLKIWRQKLF